MLGLRVYTLLAPKGPIVYGESVSIKSPYGRGKFLRVGAFGTVVLAR